MTDTGEGQTTDHAEDSAAPESSAPNIIALRDGHTVTLAPEVTPAIAVGFLTLVDQGSPSVAVMFGKLAEFYLDSAIIDWDYPDAITPESIRRLVTVGNGAIDVAERADALYQDAISVPLGERLSRRLPRTPTGSSTPPTRGSGSTPAKRSKRSSRNATAGKLSVVPAP